MEEARIVCYPGDGTTDYLTNLVKRKTQNATYTKPLTISYLSETPTLKVQYKRPSKVLVAGETLIATCEAVVETGQTIVWELITTSKKYTWKAGQSQQLPTWVKITVKTDQYQYYNYSGPQMHSTLQIVVYRRMENARLDCYSYEGLTHYFHPTTSKNVVTLVSEQPFLFSYADRKPIIWVNGNTAVDSLAIYDGTVFMTNCTASVGKKKQMTMGVVYRGGARVWFATYQYDNQTGDFKKSDYGNSKDGFAAGEVPKSHMFDVPRLVLRLAKYILHPIYGHLIMGVLEIKVSPPLEGCIIMCYPDTLSTNDVLNLTADQDSRGTWTVPLAFNFAVSVPDLEVKYAGVQGMFVEANCSADVGSKGALQWKLLISNWLSYCWAVDTHGSIKGTLPPFIIQDNKTKGQISYTYNNRTGPHLISYITFKRPKEWKVSQLICAVDNPLRFYVVRPQDKPKLAKFEMCKEDLILSYVPVPDKEAVMTLSFILAFYILVAWAIFLIPKEGEEYYYDEWAYEYGIDGVGEAHMERGSFFSGQSNFSKN
ncbi:hypothetical protein PoB_005574500 [Plakobranchus ocellatus]|uniref:Ig-like domain-containing protein n=1 Tax=Plakobranchus ocellatus TaxID=259542 RepID=A0AAV4CC43_9GAST|nr:hypothetical protein PoB_005574500 [Plakobranchus ocellatus]